MKNSEKRTLEIYLTLLLQKIRKDNSNALEDIHNFIYGPSFIKNYNPAFLYKICIDNLEILEKIPTRTEIILTLDTNEKSPIYVTAKLYKALGIRTISSSEKRILKFSLQKSSLYPKINIEHFHDHLLTFLTNYATISVNLPLKSRRKNGRN